MRGRKNAVVRPILEVLSKESGLEAYEIAEKGDLEYITTMVTLSRLASQGSIERKKVERGKITVDKEEKIVRPRYVYVYTISQKGIDRLEYIQKRKE